VRQIMITGVPIESWSRLAYSCDGIRERISSRKCTGL
jgi:hypothetical protein